VCRPGPLPGGASTKKNETFVPPYRYPSNLCAILPYDSSSLLITRVIIASSCVRIIEYLSSNPQWVAPSQDTIFTEALWV
jgi:hypothetical protein